MVLKNLVEDLISLVHPNHGNLESKGNEPISK
jgi:hypothetical protein